MYRNVYWHHAVRSATSMFKRLVRDAIAAGQLDSAWIARSTDEALMERLHALPDVPLAQRLRRRRLFKRALDLPATDLPAAAGSWIADDPSLTAAVEDQLALELGVKRGELLLDFPAKAHMLSVDLPFLNRRGTLERAQVGLEPVADALHRAARRLRVFVAEPRPIAPEPVRKLVEQDAAAMKDALARGTALLG
jgi:hypothetical protein